MWNMESLQINKIVMVKNYYLKLFKFNVCDKKI